MAGDRCGLPLGCSSCSLGKGDRLPIVRSNDTHRFRVLAGCVAELAFRPAACSPKAECVTIERLECGAHWMRVRAVHNLKPLAALAAVFLLLGCTSQGVAPAHLGPSSCAVDERFPGTWKSSRRSQLGPARIRGCEGTNVRAGVSAWETRRDLPRCARPGRPAAGVRERGPEGAAGGEASRAASGRAGGSRCRGPSTRDRGAGGRGLRPPPLRTSSRRSGIPRC